MFSTLGGGGGGGGGAQYIGGIPYIEGGCVHQGDTMMSTSGDIMSTLGDVQYIGVFNKNQKSFMNLLPTSIMIFLRCTEHLPMY